MTSPAGDPRPAQPPVIAGHPAVFDADGGLVPWTSWNRTLDLEMEFYRGCPWDRGYPRFAYVTFLDADWTPSRDRTDTIPSTQIGMGIVSYLKYAALRGERGGGSLSIARGMGEYLVNESLTPPGGKYPSFTRSTGRRDCFPLPEDAGSQSDRPFEIEPDKGGIAGYALALLAEATGERRYLDQALQNARVLAANQRKGDAFHSPWPFRADFRTGEARGPVSGNTAYILRLYDALIERGFDEFSAPRALLWSWVTGYQLPSAQSDGSLFAQFFEDHDTPTNRTAWAPLNLARYLLEKKDLVHRGWRTDCDALIGFVRRTFTHTEFGVTVCHEQDEDKQAWGGVVSTYGAVLAMYADAIGSAALAREARACLSFARYAVDEHGRPRDIFLKAAPGGWQEDAHTDVIHNVVDALRTNPEWGG